MDMRTTLLPGVSLLAALAACGGGGSADDDNTPDARINPADAAITADAAPTFDAPPLPDAGPLPDAAPDIDGAIADAAPLACSPTGDYIEADDAGNDAFHSGAIEDSGLTFTNLTSVTIGGCIDPTYADATDPPVADADIYSVTLGGTASRFVSGRITSPDGAAADGGFVDIYDGNGNFVGGGSLANGDGPISPAFVTSGTLYVAVYHPDSTLATGYTYQVKLEVLTCTQPSATDYIESGDGATSRGNDMFGVTWGPFAMTATAATDTAEATGLTLDANQTMRLRGRSADVTSDGDEYLDRDTFAFTTGAATRRIAVMVTWNTTTFPGNDLDFLVLPADQIDTTEVIGAGASVGEVVERSGAVVAPGTDYWTWVANYTGSTPTAAGVLYNLTVCGYD